MQFGELFGSSDYIMKEGEYTCKQYDKWLACEYLHEWTHYYEKTIK